MHKLSYLNGNEWLEHLFLPIFTPPNQHSGSTRLTAGVPGGDASIFEQLVSCLEPPYLVLYVLHTPRGEGKPGRYQSPELSVLELHEFIAKYQNYFAADARFDLWAYSPSEQATVVWDRHNQLFAYGPIERYIDILQTLGFQIGSLKVPVPHQHHYRPECDASAAALLADLNWSYSPLRLVDEQ